MTAAVELVAAVREFLGGLALEGREAFHAKVAANALAIVERELAGNAAAIEVAALTPVVGATKTGASELRASVCAAIRDGTLTVATPGLLDALIVATCARLTVDNPRYPTLARLSIAAEE